MVTDKGLRALPRPQSVMTVDQGSVACFESAISTWVDDRPGVDVIKRSTVSTGHLRAFLPLQLPPINPVIFRGSHGPEARATLILEGASHLDAFSGYPCHT